ncbi:hypothetical protein B0H11DRAFT_2094479 [Mycena galericulata]|nr:hypothetical protein B0H11DRAFT_2094479 [Mycena galericulata]
MSQKITHVALDTRSLLQPSPQAFPAAWLIRTDDKYVIDPADWNRDSGPPIDSQLSVDWEGYYGAHILTRVDFGVEIGGVIVRHYFGVEGCIVPVGCLPGADESIVAFTTAGPCDDDGRKKFYIIVHFAPFEGTSLYCYTSGFRSLADFHQNRGAMKSTKLSPVPGGEEVVLDKFVDCGYCERLVEEEIGSVLNWDP